MAGLVPAIPIIKTRHSWPTITFIFSRADPAAPYAAVYDALQREKNMKHWPRVYKTRLIGQSNPTWRDLYPEISGP
jgi:hypothetical protein